MAAVHFTTDNTMRTLHSPQSTTEIPIFAIHFPVLTTLSMLGLNTLCIFLMGVVRVFMRLELWVNVLVAKVFDRISANRQPPLMN